ncbi:aminoacyl-tRNA deacylase [Cellulomonas sp. SLBN-39]|uniref:aminoacyl-tRNA deacylase n=1 Tax=Cellulomonas sp. SLBN-39 TaxID=2768446 RepID=UPI00116FF0D9|nr:YbaK/EbsC family protein [Cellulomonas sp. SLBN-39]TQL02101.1 Cys-tRNA(Pro) deacylase [Cellulomonas sp. SLBN-39]
MTEPSPAPPGAGLSTEGEARVVAALDAAGVAYTRTRHGRVGSLAEAAAARGIAPADLLKTIVVRRGDDDFLLVLLPGDRAISWPRLRALLGVSRMSMPDAATALAVTGFERGTITPFGTTRTWPVVVDERAVGRTVSIGGGGHGVGVTLAADDLVRVLGATVADVSEPQA